MSVYGYLKIPAVEIVVILIGDVAVFIVVVVVAVYFGFPRSPVVHIDISGTNSNFLILSETIEVFCLRGRYVLCHCSAGLKGERARSRAYAYAFIQAAQEATDKIRFSLLYLALEERAQAKQVSLRESYNHTVP